MTGETSSSFVRSVRESEVPHPTQRGFGATKWTRVYEKSDKGVLDERLYLGGVWVYEALSRIRADLGLLRLEEFPRTRVRTAVGVLNLLSREILTRPDAGRAGAGTMTLSRIEPVRRVESLINAGRHVLSQLMQEPFGSRPGREMPDALVSAVALAMEYDWFEHKWLMMLWRGWHVDLVGDVATLRLGDTELERAMMLARLREEDLKSQFGFAVHRWWEGLSDQERARSGRLPRVVEVKRRKGGHKKLILGSDDGTELSPELTMQMRVESLYAPELVAEALPGYGGLTIQDLLLTWRVLSSACKSLTARFPPPPPMEDVQVGGLSPFAPTFRRRDLELAVRRALRTDAAVASVAVEAFCFNGSPREDLWQRPLVPVSDGQVSLVAPATESPNLLRSIESWARAGGSTLSERGGAFEAHLRNELRQGNRREDSDISSRSITLRAGSEQEEIDLLIRLGSHLFVGEIKATLHPSSPLEEAHYFDRIEEGAVQVKRKARWVSENLPELQSFADFNLAAVDTVHGLVLSNLPLATGIVFEEIPVTDLSALSLYLGSGSLLLAVRLTDERQARELKLFSSEKSAGQELLGYLLKPPQLAMIEDSVTETVGTTMWNDGRRRTIRLASLEFDPGSIEQAEDAADRLLALGSRAKLPRTPRPKGPDPQPDDVS